MTVQSTRDNSAHVPLSNAVRARFLKHSNEACWNALIEYHLKRNQETESSEIHNLTSLLMDGLPGVLYQQSPQSLLQINETKVDRCLIASIYMFVGGAITAAFDCSHGVLFEMWRMDEDTHFACEPIVHGVAQFARSHAQKRVVLSLLEHYLLLGTFYPLSLTNVKIVRSQIRRYLAPSKAAPEILYSLPADLEPAETSIALSRCWIEPRETLRPGSPANLISSHWYATHLTPLASEEHLKRAVHYLSRERPKWISINPTSNNSCPEEYSTVLIYRSLCKTWMTKRCYSRELLSLVNGADEKQSSCKDTVTFEMLFAISLVIFPPKKVS
jgi:hypothetical protein